MASEIAADASSLIYLAKADGFMEATTCLDRPLGASASVWREAVEEGERIGAGEVPRIRTAAERGDLVRIVLSDEEAAYADDLAASYRLGRGESETLSYVRRSGRAIVDEGRASRVGTLLGVATIPTLLVPVIGAEQGRLDRGSATVLVRRLAVACTSRADVLIALEERIRGDVT